MGVFLLAMLAIVVAVLAAAVLLVVFGIVKLRRAREYGRRPVGGIVMIVIGAVLVPLVLASLGAVWLLAPSPAPAPVVRPAAPRTVAPPAPPPVPPETR